MFLKLFLFSLALVSVGIFGMTVRVFFSKWKKFAETRVGHNKELRKRKIFCVNTEQKIIDKNIKKRKYSGGSCSNC